jgi:multicomponent Na+:H+ antiporter subunit B
MQARVAILVASGGIFAALVFAGLAGLHDFGRYDGAYGRIVNHTVVPARHVTNVVAGVVFDVRAVDTMGEEFILFAAMIGTALLLRESREEEEGEDAASNETERLLGVGAVPVVVLVGLWIVAFGYVTPGGGFQGGVVLAGAALLVWVGGRYDAYRRSSPVALVHAVEGIGAAGYVIIGAAALASGLAFLEALVGPGKTGTLTAGGSIPFLNWASGIEVAAALVLLFHEFLQEYVPTLRRRGR